MAVMVVREREENRQVAAALTQSNGNAKKKIGGDVRRAALMKIDIHGGLFSTHPSCFTAASALLNFLALE